MPRTHSPAGPLLAALLASLALAPAQAAPQKSGKAVKPAAKTADKAPAKPVAAGKLAVGSPAPALNVAKWIKGQPVSGFEPGKVYVVEFWATWCGPCRATIPHLTELAKKYQGKATITGVSVFERPEPDYMEKVAEFVKEMGPKMEYRVAVDGPQGTMGKTWMEAAQQQGIPTAFVVGKKGTVEWIGHPMDGLDEVIGGVIAGTFNPKTAAAEKAKKEAEQAKISGKIQGIVAKAQAGDFAAALTEVDAFLAANPDLEKQGLWNLKLQILVRGGNPGVMDYIKKVGEGPVKDSAEGLNALAWMIVDPQSPIKTRDYDVALALATRAAELSKEENAGILDTLAYAQFKKGDTDKALATGEKALALAAKDASLPAPVKQELQKHQDEYKAAKGK